MVIIDGLCDAIQDGQSVPEFIKLHQRLYQEELSHAHDSDSPSVKHHHQEVKLDRMDQAAMQESNQLNSSLKKLELQLETP